VADPIATRYAQAAFEAAKAEGVVEETLEQLALIGGLVSDHALLRELMLNPDVDPPDKVGVLERSLKGSWSALTKSLIQVVVAFGRADLLPDMADAFQSMVDVEQGVVRAVVRSAHPLPAAVVERLRGDLTRREQKQVVLMTEVDPELLGGLQVQLGHRVIDSSVRRQLVELRQRLTAIRVY